MKLILDYFTSMSSGRTLGRRIYGRYGALKVDTYHRLIEGFIPHYSQLADENADANLKQTVNPAFPLVLSPAVSSVSNVTSAYPSVVLANESSALAKVIYTTDLWHFYSDDASNTDLGIPSGTPASNAGIDAVIFNGKILTSHPSVGSLYYGAINATPSWTSSGSFATGIVKIMHVIEDRCLVLDSSQGAGMPRDRVQLIATGFTASAGFSIGSSDYDIQDIADYQARYALLFAHKTTTGSSSPRLTNNTTVFLWDVVAGDSYDQKLSLPGSYVCSIVKQGTVYAFTQNGPSLSCFAFDGAGFKEIGRIKNVRVSTDLLIPKTRIGIEGDFFVLLASSSDVAHNTPFYWNPATGESFFLFSPIAGLPFKSILYAQDPSSGISARYLAYQNSGGVGVLYKITLENTTKADMGAAYASNVIPAPLDGKLYEGPFGRMNIERIEIEYDAPPPSASDIITFTLTTKDEYENETYTTQTATIKDTTAHSTNAIVDTKRAIIPLGAKATEFEIGLAVTVATTSWNLIIRRIVIIYQPLALQI